MGYRSQVRCLVYGDTDKLQALITKHELMGSGVMDQFNDSLKRYTCRRRSYDHEATLMQPQDENGGRQPVICERIVEVLDLTGDDWKWYSDYPDVAAWTAMMLDAAMFDCSYEFMRIGEEDNDIETERNVLDDGDQWLVVSRKIECEIEPDEETSNG